jgi:hypothetical protein
MRRGSLSCKLIARLDGGCVYVADHDSKAGRTIESQVQATPHQLKPSSTLAKRFESLRNAGCDSMHIPCPSGVPFRAICTRRTPKPQSRVRLRYHKAPWPSSKDLGSIQGRLRTMYNASTTTQPTSSAISDTSVRMEWEARKSGQEGSLWTYSTTPISSWNRNKIPKLARLGDRRTTIRELQWVRCRETGFRPSLRITPFLPGCC